LHVSRRKVEIFPPTLTNGIKKIYIMSNQHYQIHINNKINPYKHRAYLTSNAVAISKSSWCPFRSDTRRLFTASLKASLTFATAGRMAGDYKQHIDVNRVVKQCCHTRSIATIFTLIFWICPSIAATEWL
jgi:hypothetical protein